MVWQLASCAHVSSHQDPARAHIPVAAVNYVDNRAGYPEKSLLEKY